MRGAIPPLPNTPSWHGAQLKHRDNFTFIQYNDMPYYGQTVKYGVEIKLLLLFQAVAEMAVVHASPNDMLLMQPPQAILRSHDISNQVREVQDRMALHIRILKQLVRKERDKGKI
jgi:hypothetical protein